MLMLMLVVVVVQGMGVAGSRAATCEELAAQLAAALERAGPSLIEAVPVNGRKKTLFQAAMNQECVAAEPRSFVIYSNVPATLQRRQSSCGSLCLLAVLHHRAPEDGWSGWGQ